MRSSNGTLILSATDPEPSSPNPEVAERARRRQFTAAYKARILHETETCEPGQIGALLRREGLYSSHLTHWRQQRDRGLLAALAPRRGRPIRAAEEQELVRLRQENERLTQKLVAAEAIIDIQKKVSALLGLTAHTAEHRTS